MRVHDPAAPADTLTMLITAHVAAGAAIGAAINKPIPAFLAGVASHFAMDALPHWGGKGDTHSEEFLKVAKIDGVTGLAEIVVLAAAAGDRRLPVLAGIFGACLPDIDKPCDIYLHFDPFPEPVNTFHKGIQNEYTRGIVKDVAVGVILAASSYAVLRLLAHKSAA